MSAYVYQPFPKMRYRSIKTGERITLEYCIVNDQREMDALPSDWGGSPEDAKAQREKLEEDVSNAAAERAYADQRLSKKAQKEMAAKEAATGHHVPE